MAGRATPWFDPLARDLAARDFRRYLQVEKRAAASTVNLALASLDALYRCLGLAGSGGSWRPWTTGGVIVKCCGFGKKNDQAASLWFYSSWLRRVP